MYYYFYLIFSHILFVYLQDQRWLYGKLLNAMSISMSDAQLSDVLYIVILVILLNEYAESRVTIHMQSKILHAHRTLQIVIFHDESGRPPKNCGNFEMAKANECVSKSWTNLRQRLACCSLPSQITPWM